MAKHWIVTKKKNKRKLVEALHRSNFEIPLLPKGKILEGIEKEEALAKFDIWNEKLKAKDKTLSKDETGKLLEKSSELL